MNLIRLIKQGDSFFRKDPSTIKDVVSEDFVAEYLEISSQIMDIAETIIEGLSEELLDVVLLNFKQMLGCLHEKLKPGFVIFEDAAKEVGTNGVDTLAENVLKKRILSRDNAVEIWRETIRNDEETWGNFFDFLFEINGEVFYLELGARRKKLLNEHFESIADFKFERSVEGVFWALTHYEEALEQQRGAKGVLNRGMDEMLGALPEDEELDLEARAGFLSRILDKTKRFLRSLFCS